MKTILNKEVISTIFKEFPQLNRMWVKGDLETFHDSEFIIGEELHPGELAKFIYCHFDFDDFESGPVVLDEAIMRNCGSLDESYIECKKEDYV